MKTMLLLYVIISLIFFKELIPIYILSVLVIGYIFYKESKTETIKESIFINIDDIRKE